jgi:hypothetical protein
VRQIADDKSYLQKSVFGGNMFALLTRVWRSTDVFAELPRSVADATEHYAKREGDTEQRLFWAQFQAPEHPPLLSNQMKQVMELHWMAGPAMKDLCVWLWPTEPI